MCRINDGCKGFIKSFYNLGSGEYAYNVANVRSWDKKEGGGARARVSKGNFENTECSLGCVGVFIGY